MKTNKNNRITCIIGMLLCVMGVASAKNGGAVVNKTNKATNVAIEYVVEKPNLNSIVPPTKYSFTYDNENRLVEKMVYKWNESCSTWETEFSYQYIYLDNGFITEHTVNKLTSIMYDSYSDELLTGL